MLKIVIDAGHGPYTPGKRSPDGQLKEFEFNESVARRIKKRIQNENLLCIFSHDISRDVPLKERITLANRLKVDLFVSIHANAFGVQWNDVNGIETYTCLRAGTKTKSLATLIHQELITLTRRKNRGIKQEDFAVLRETTMPAVLVECGFMTNQQEMKLLKDPMYQQKCADGISSGILQFLKK
ncbi:MAG: N-acetylmuramoyl-L-alanine amidase [Paenisporosarcina sp.]|nr:N-acetylmuramoyl-L-alanine amidase [Paenisporosarcina sp.]